MNMEGLVKLRNDTVHCFFTDLVEFFILQPIASHYRLHVNIISCSNTNNRLKSCNQIEEVSFEYQTESLPIRLIILV